MYRDFELAREAGATPPVAPTHFDTTGPGTSESGWLALARQRRADHIRVFFTERLSWRREGRLLAIATAAVFASVLLVMTYAHLLSQEGVPASATVLLAVLIASTVSSIAGFAFSAVCGAMLLTMMSNPVEVVEIMMVCSIAIQALSVVLLWRDIDWRCLLPFVGGGLIGLPLGVWLLLHADPLRFKEAIGGLLTIYAIYALCRRPGPIHLGGGLADACVGFAGGITGGFAGFPGAATAIWCGMRGWDKRRQRGIYQPFILIMQVLALALIELMRASIGRGAVGGVELFQFIPVALLGTWFGLSIFRRLSDRNFSQVLNLLLLVSGVTFLV